MRNTGNGRHLLPLSGAIAAGLLAVAAPAQGQQQLASDVRWQAWLGCWQTAAAAPLGGMTQTVRADAKTPVVCVVPTSGSSAVELVTVAGGQVTERERVEAGGAARSVSRDGCTGTEQAQWSADARRVYLRSDLSCPGGIARHSNGVLSFTPSGELLDIRSITAGAQAGVRVARLRPLVDSVPLPAELASARVAPGLATSTARLAAAAAISTSDIVDAARKLDARVLEAWLVERGDQVKLDARHLAELADAGVPGSVTDLLVAIANPKVFAIDRGNRTGTQRTSDGTELADRAPGGGRVIPIYLDPFGYGYGGYGYDAFGYGYGYGARGYGYGYGYNPYGYGWYGGSPIVVVVRDPNNGTGDSRPRAINGRGYTRDRGTGSGGDAATPRATRDGGYSGGSSSSGGSSRTSDGGSSSGRTARPKP